MLWKNTLAGLFYCNVRVWGKDKPVGKEESDLEVVNKQLYAEGRDGIFSDGWKAMGERDLI